MRTYFDVYAIKLTEENIPQIIELTTPLGWTLGGHLKDNMEFNAEEDGEDTMLYMKIYQETGEIATFADEGYDPNNLNIRLTDEVDPLFGIFHKFEKI
jgi:hypothetical protein